VRKILIIRLSSLGDVILTFPVLHILREAYPQAEIVPLVKDSFAEAFAANRDISRLMTLDAGESLPALIQRVRAEHFDAIVDLHGNLRSRLLCLFAGVSRVVRYRKAMLARRLYVGWRVPSSELQRHTLDRYLAALRELDPHQPLFQRPIMRAAPQSILLIQTAFLGDAVLTTPLVDALHRQWPQSPLTLLSTPETAEVFRRLPGVQDVIVYDKRGRERSFGALMHLIGSLRDRRFALAIIPHRSFKSALMACLARIPRRIGFSASQGRWLLTDVIPFQWGVHDVDRNMALLTALGVDAPAPRLTMSPDPHAVEGVKARLAAAGLRPETRLVGIHAGSVWATKRWLPERFAEVADRLMAEPGTQVVFVGGPKDREATEALVQSMKQRPLNWVGETSLGELVAVIGRCSVFLTNDSGPMHVAVACGVPTVAIFGPTTKELGFFPYGPGHRVIEKDLPCRPCGLHGADECPLGHFQCMRLITSDEVTAAVQDVLSTADSAKAVAP
jgi:heptosyltransferase II